MAKSGKSGKSGTKRKLGSAWVDEIEGEIDSLRDLRAELRRRLSDFDLEGESIWEEQERRWRRLEVKLAKVAARTTEGVGQGLATNIENLVAAMEEAYQDLDGLLD